MTTGLSDIRVVDFSSEIAGPYCSKLLADAGADVVKIESTAGDPLRAYTATGADLGGEDSALFRYLNTSKRSVVGEMGEAHVTALVAAASILIEDGRVTIDIATLRKRHRHLVIVSITPYGRRGPYGIDRPATEFTVQAESGSLLSRGRPWRRVLGGPGPRLHRGTPRPGAALPLRIGRPLDAPGHGDHGMDNSEILTRILGLSRAEIAELEAGGIIGTRPKGL